MTMQAALDRAIAAHRAGNLADAITGYRQVLADGGGAAVANWLAIALDQTGDPGGAERALREAVARDSGAPEAFLNLGRLLARRGAVAESLAPLQAAAAGGVKDALPILFAAAAALPDDRVLTTTGDTLLRSGALQKEQYRHLVAAYLRAGRLREGRDRARAAVLVAPASLDAIILAAEVARTVGAPQEAIRLRRRAAAVAPGSPLVHVALALVAAGAGGDGTRFFRRALCLDPGSAERWSDYGALLKPMGDAAPTRAAMTRAVMLDPTLVPALRNLAVLLSDIAEMDAARAVYDRALAVAPDDAGLAFKRALTFPTITRSEAEIDAIRAEIEERVSALARSGQRLVDPLAEVGLPNFYLAYHGRNDRALQSLIADTYLALSPDLAYVAPHCRTPRPATGRRLRVGFVSRFFYDHSIRDLSATMIRRLDRSRFEVHVITDRPASEITLFRPGEQADRHTILPIDLPAARATIAELELDALVYGDIGMEPLTYYLAFARLAPVQAHLQGHPITPGIPNLDYFVTSALQEPEGYLEHYREMPVALSRTYFCYEPMPEVPPATRADFALPASGALYYCTQTLFKFHPDFDGILRRILEGDPEGWLLLIEDKNPARTRQVNDRLAATLGACHDRVIWVPRLPKQRFFQLMKLSAVTLDTTHFTGGNTTLQALGLGVPVVTLPGRFVRGRLTLGWLAEAGLMEMCAHDPEDYARIALRFGLDPAWRAEVVERIEASRPKLFGQPAVVEEIQDFLAEAIAAARAGRPKVRWGDRESR